MHVPSIRRCLRCEPLGLSLLLLQRKFACGEHPPRLVFHSVSSLNFGFVSKGCLGWDKGFVSGKQCARGGGGCCYPSSCRPLDLLLLVPPHLLYSLPAAAETLLLLILKSWQLRFCWSRARCSSAPLQYATASLASWKYRKEFMGAS